MAQYELLLPKMGESVAEATVIKWLKQPGDMIGLDDTVLEIATDKVDSEVPSPVSGKLVRQLYQEDDVVQVGAVIAIIETEAAMESVPATQKNTAPSPEIEDSESDPSIMKDAGQQSPVSEEIPGITQLDQQIPRKEMSYAGSDRFYSPLVKNIAAQEQISMQELELIKGSGAEGRLTKDDLFNYINSRRSESVSSNDSGSLETGEAAPQVNADLKASVAEVPAGMPASGNCCHGSSVGTDSGVKADKPGISVSGSDEIIEMDRMGKLISDHMVMSKQTSAHVTSFVEADVTNMVLWRERIKNNFEKRENEKITFTPIFIEAVAKAIKDFPLINVSVNGTTIIKKRDINIGMAAALPNGNLIVPVIKNADQLNMVGLTKAVNDLAVRARNSKLKPDETQNGTFTLTNVGSFGNVMGTPIINQPQVAILAVGTIKKKPAVLETEFGDVIAIRHMMFLSLSYDHRVVNGALGGTFVRRVADYLENWDMNREL